MSVVDSALSRVAQLWDIVKFNLDNAIDILKADVTLAHNNFLNQIKLESDFAKTSYDMALKRLDQGMQTSMDTLQSAVNSVGKSVSESAFEIAKTMRSRVESNLKQNVEIQFEERKLNLRQQLDKAQYEIQQHIDELKSVKERRDFAMKVINMGASEVFNKHLQLEDLVGKAAIAILDFEKGFTDDIRKNFQENYEKQLEFEKELALKKIEYESKLMDIRQGLAGRVNKEFLNIERTATTIGYSMGIATSLADKFHLGITNAAHAMADLNKSVEDIMKLQTTWASSTGRTSGLSESDMRNAFAMGNLSDQGSVDTIIGAANLFNKSATQTSQVVFKAYQMANKMGLSGQKVVKDIAKNMELMNKINFRNGIDGMMQMAVWAEKVRFDMGKLDSMIGKTVDGGLEGLISQSAKFNVLGGAAAAMSDPFGMAFDALSDPDAYAKRMVAMTEGMGMWNSRTGKVDFTMEETLRMRQIAALQGQSYEDLAKQVQEREKRARVDKLIGARYGEGADAVASHAFFDEKSQRWMVNVMGDNGQYAKKDITQLSQADINSLSPAVEPLEDLVNIARKLLSIQEKQEAEAKDQMTSMVIGSRGNLMNTNKTILTKIHEDFVTNAKNYKELITQGLNDIVAAQQSVYDSYIAEKKAIEEQLEVDAQNLMLAQGVTNQYSDFNSQLTSYTNTLAEANRVMTGILDKLRPYTQSAPNSYVQTQQTNAVDYLKNQGGAARGERTREEVSKDLPVGVIKGVTDAIDKVANVVKKGSGSLRYDPLGINNARISGRFFSYPSYTFTNPATPPIPFAPVNDFSYSGGPAMIIADNRAYRTQPDDVITAAKSGGVVDRITEQDALNNLRNGSVNVNVVGELVIKGENGVTIPIMEQLRRDPVLLHNFTAMIFNNKDTNRVSNTIDV